mgnify:CR=1 FL=1|tara:strand:+ start:197 stop:1642 length:1446 start_codon:yes stop_codon:yes gene_type:complete
MELLIQKVCNCCQKELLDLFHDYLIKTNNLLPAELIKTIQKSPFETISFYSLNIYKNENKESIKKLTQLAHHTLKLFSFVSQNFPSFLWHNIQEIEWMIFKNDKIFLNDKIKHLKEVADKFENYQLLIQLTRIVKQQADLEKTLINSLLNNDNLSHLNDIENLLLLQNKIIKENTSSKRMVTASELKLFTNLFKSNSKSVEILSKQSYLNVLSTCNHPDFYNKKTLQLINDTIKETEKYGYLIIAQYTEKLMSLDYMLVKHTRLTLNEKEMNKACSSIIKKWQNYYTAETKLDIGLTMAISIKGSYYLTNYFFNTIPKKLENEIADITVFVGQLIKNTNWESEGHLKYINMCNVHALYLILNNDALKASNLIEKVLHEYQQKQFNKLYDGIFVVLVMAYFQAKKYDEVVDTFNRYKKVTKGEVSVQENDLVIKGLYYIAQLKLKNSKQYADKLSIIIKELSKNKLMENNLELIQRVQTSIL